jgi:hypothetical protein
MSLLRLSSRIPLTKSSMQERAPIRQRSDHRLITFSAVLVADRTSLVRAMIQLAQLPAYVLLSDAQRCSMALRGSMGRGIAFRVWVKSDIWKTPSFTVQRTVYAPLQDCAYRLDVILSPSSDDSFIRAAKYIPRLHPLTQRQSLLQSAICRPSHKLSLGSNHGKWRIGWCCPLSSLRL